MDKSRKNLGHATAGVPKPLFSCLRTDLPACCKIMKIAKDAFSRGGIKVASENRLAGTLALPNLRPCGRASVPRTDSAGLLLPPIEHI
jgi:hypothetical protein